MQFFNTWYSIQDKSDSSPVTDADKIADKYIRENIWNLYPDDQIISEEFLSTPDTNKNIRYIDPLDWTKNFIAWESTFSVIIWMCNPWVWATQWLIYFPATQEFFYTSGNKIIYENKEDHRIIDMDFSGKIFYKESALQYQQTKQMITWIPASQKISIKPSWYAAKEAFLNNSNMLIFGHWYLYELCAFDALIKCWWGQLTNCNGECINYYGQSQKITDGCIFWQRKN